MACSIDQQNTSVQGGGFGLRRGSTDNQLLATPFVNTNNAGICRVDLQMVKNGSPTGNVWVEIWTNNAGSPGAIIGSKSSNVDVSTLGSHAFQAFTWASGYPSVNASGTYWIVLSGDFAYSTTNNCDWDVNNNASFNEMKGFDNSSWSTKSTWRGLFKQYTDTSFFTTTSTSTSTTSSTSSSTSTSTSSSSSTSTSTSTSSSTSSSSTSSSSTTTSGLPTTTSSSTSSSSSSSSTSSSSTTTAFGQTSTSSSSSSSTSSSTSTSSSSSSTSSSSTTTPPIYRYSSGDMVVIPLWGDIDPQ